MIPLKPGQFVTDRHGRVWQRLVGGRLGTDTGHILSEDVVRRTSGPLKETS